ncbi:hypothetical protein [Afifella sp. IM 167]|uniref:hypothetical protein n=1 Tax=Afifella sp. IM 167 TaxID=2033586 RepID=UPI001CCF646D|nr:hypothetical protein [Afifella sp. IM 167]
MRQRLSFEIDPAFANAEGIRDGLSPMELVRRDVETVASFFSRLRQPRRAKVAAR